MTRRAVNFALALVLGAAASASAQAQVPADVTVVIPEVLAIDVATTTISFGTVDQADLDALEILAAATSTLTHRANRPHAVQLEATGAAMENTDPVNTTVKPTTDLMLSVDGGTTWVGVGPLGTPASLLTSPRGRYTATVSYKLLVDYDDAPDTYAMTFNYTIIAN